MSLTLWFLPGRRGSPASPRRAPAEPRPAPSPGGALTALVLAGADCLVICAAFGVAYLLRFHLQLAFWYAAPAPVTEYLKAMAAVGYLWLLLFYSLGLYDLSRPRSRLDIVQTVVKAVTLGTLVLLSLSFFYRQFTFSRLVCLYAWAISIVLFSALRIAWHAARRRSLRRGRGLVDAALIGSCTVGRFIAEKVVSDPGLGYRLLGWIDDGPSGAGLPLPRLGGLDELEEVLDRHRPRVVLLTHPTLGHLELLRVIEACERRGIALRMAPPTFDLMVNYRDFEEVDGIPLVRVNEQEYRRWSDLAKRLFDLSVSAVALVLAAPLLALAAAAIRLEDGGPAFFRQRRVGKDGRPFWMYKLRTMVVGAEERLPELVDLHQLGEPVFKLDHDPRVTRVGRFLRRTSLDEFPQLLNVLRGEMSLVGPRPEEEALVERYGVWERRRLKCLPGITGLQQVECRATKSLKERVRWDILYLRKRCLVLDAWILLRTLWVVASGKGAR